MTRTIFMPGWKSWRSEPLSWAEGLLDLRQFRPGVGGAVHAGENVQGLVLAALLRQPARAFGDDERQDQQPQGRQRLRAEHPPPAEPLVPGASPCRAMK